MSNEIAAKLAAAVNEDVEESAATTKEALEQPAGKETKASAEQTKETATQKGKQTQSQSVPYDRFKEKVDALEQATAKLEEFTTRDKELSVQIAKLEQSHDVLERLRGLAQDDRYKPLVEKLDKALRGVHEEVEAGDKTEKQGDKEVTKLFSDHKAELEDAFAQQRADLLWQQVQSISSQMLDALGEDYDDNDREAIARLWNPETNWDAIEENPDVMRDELLGSLKRVVETYGEPRGALKAKISQFEQKSQQTTEVTPAIDPEKELKGILDKEWGKVKVSPEGKTLGAEHSDEEFAATLAKVMKMGRR